jgi:hypothetical protein
MLLFVTIILEFFLYVFLKTMLENYSYSSQVETRNNIVANNAGSIINNPSLMVLHPYLGYVYDPTRNTRGLKSHHGGISINDYGFLDDSSPFHQKKEDTLIIGIFGGSLAFFFSSFGVDALVRKLHSSPIFADKKIEIVRVALGGYKQPQQLIGLTYLLAQGAEFDVVINLDGFNEVALPPIDNLPNNVSPYYPRNWNWQSNTVMSNKTKSLVGRISLLGDLRRGSASVVNGSVLRFSNTMNLIWLVSDKFMAGYIGRKQRELNVTTAQDQDSYQHSGPEYPYVNDASMFRDMAGFWSQSSQQMAKLCEANQILYWHFLQPNQYFPDSKIIGTEEAKVVLNSESPYKTSVEQGYPALVNSGLELAKSATQFHDLSMIFKDQSQALYLDDCCHLNDSGNEILGDTIGRLILKDIDRSGGQPETQSNLY